MLSTEKLSGKAKKSKSGKSTKKSSKGPTVSSKPQLPLLPQPLASSNLFEDLLTKFPQSGDYYHEMELPGIIPLCLSPQTQAKIKVVANVDLNASQMYKMLSKQDLVDDISTRQDSEFVALKELITNYAKEEIMIHYDPEAKYSQNYFLVVDVKVSDLILNPPVLQSAAKSKKVRGWVSQGSEREVEQEWIKSLDKPARIQLIRPYHFFNKPCSFKDQGANDGPFVDIKSYKDYNFDIYKLQSEIGIQAVPKTVENTSQTTWNRSINFAVQYEPLEMTVVEQEEIQNSSSFKEFFFNASPLLEQFLQQNEIMDIFTNQYSLLGDDDTTLEQGAQTVLQEYQSFTDLLNSKDKCVSCIDWHPTQKGIVAMSCTMAYGFEDRISHSSASKSRRPVILLWSFNDPFHPQLILEAPADVACFKFNPENPSIIAAGCINGQLVLWDISEYNQKLAATRKNDKELTPKDEKDSVSTVPYAVVSSIELGHRAPITDLHWFPKNFELGNHSEVMENGDNGDKQLVSCSLDGTVAFWDLRYKKDWKSLDLAWKPFNRVPITSVDSSSDYSLTKISLLTRFDDSNPKTNGGTVAETKSSELAKVKPSSKTFSSKFYCSTEEGDIIYADWIAAKDKKTTADEKPPSRVEFTLHGHFGPVSDLSRSPFFPDIVLSTGGWSFHIWKEKSKSGPLLSSPQFSSNVTCGKWSPTRPGVFYVGRADGVLEVWDLLDKSNAATTIQSVATSAISSISIQHYPGKSPQQFIAVGDDSGTMHILETPKNLLKAMKSEKQIITSFYERETKRLNASAERQSIHAKGKVIFEAKLAEKNAAEAKLAQAKAFESDQKTSDNAIESAEDLVAIALEKSYLQLEKKFLDQFIVTDGVF